MKRDVIKQILLILFIMALLSYTIFNYMSGRSDLPVFLVSLAMRSYFLLSMIQGLVEDLRK